MKRAGVRRRLALATALGTFLALSLTVVAGLWLLHRSLVEQVDDQLRNRAEDTTEQLSSLDVVGAGLDIDSVPIPFGGDDTFAAVWDSGGVVTRNEIPDDSHLRRLARADGTVISLAMPEVTDLAGNDDLRIAVDSVDDFRIDWDSADASRDGTRSGDPADATAAGEPVFVAVGVSLARTNALVRNVGLAAGGLTLVLSALTGVLVWFVTGRALRPVERLRTQAEAITASALDQRLPTPERDDELGRLAATLNGMLDRLDHAHRNQRRFVSDASHELRNPIAAVAAGLEVGLRDPERTDWPAVASSSLEATNRIRRLVDDLLVLARSDEGGLAINRELVDLDDVVLAQASAQRASSRVVIDTSRVSSAVVAGDPLRLGQVVGNLLANAVRHATTKVEVVVAERNGAAWLCVDDDGPGVPEAERATVFERFARLEESRERDRGGSGLGLAICREIVAAHGGEIGVGEAPAGGARFWVRLPPSLA